MNRRSRRPSHTLESPSFLRYLKPGALAQLRDSRISARTQRVQIQTPLTASPTISSPLRSPDALTQGQIGQANGPPSSPCFAGRISGPRCIQRKKLVAAKGLFFSVPGAAGSGPDSDAIVDVFSASDSNSHNNILVAH